MKNDISKKTTSKVLKQENMNENSAILLSQASKSMHEPIVPMIFPVLGMHVIGAKFMYPDLICKEL